MFDGTRKLVEGNGLQRGLVQGDSNQENSKKTKGGHATGRLCLYERMFKL
jgi:hypothetical protein